MKKIVIHTEKGINNQQKQWAKEAAKEFISMFPEYKDSFIIELKDDEAIHGHEISQAEYDRLNSVDKKDYIKNDRGKWLVPYKSAEWYILKSLQCSQKRANANTLVKLFSKHQDNTNSKDVDICLVKDCFSETTFHGIKPYILYGLTKGHAFSLSAASCPDEDLFKTVFIHEMGHIFMATTNKRANTQTDPHKGCHCSNPLCIMGPDDYDGLLKRQYREKSDKNQPPFCDECIASMREYMSHMPELTRRVQAQQMPQQPQQTPQQQQTPVNVSKPYYMPVAQPKNPSNMPPLEEWRERLQPEPHNNREWKKDIREFYKDVAARDGDTYKENIQSQNYMARIKRTDGSTLEIEANNEYNVALGRTKTTDGDITPTLKDMRDLVRYAQQKKSGMSFDKDNTPEFNARLLIACLEAGFKPYQMKNQPQVTPEFLAKIKPETRRLLQNTLNNSGQQPATRQGGRS